MYLQTTGESEAFAEMEWFAGNPQAAIRSGRPITIDIADFIAVADTVMDGRYVRSGVPVAWKDEANGVVKPDAGVAGEGLGLLIDPIVFPEGVTAGFAHGNVMTRGAVIEGRLPVAPSDELKADAALIEFRVI